jgi:serine/threonine-protein kinase
MTKMLLGQCPSREQVSAYLLGKLSEEAAETVSDHVDDCNVCQSTLKSLNDLPDSLVPLLRQSTAPTLDETDTELQRLLAQVKSVVSDSKGFPDHDCETLPPADLKLSPCPEQLDQYQLLELVGQGGMGTVYKALHTRLDKVVALKVLSADRVSSPDAVARFHREIKAVGKLDHANIVRAVDAREADGVHFLVMDFVQGTDLAKLVKARHPLPVADACELLRQAALGLQHVHEHGLIHRDLKPSNLMLTPEGQVKILDLGLARLLSPKSNDEGLTETGMVMGTADYMAPEQATDSRSVDIRADIYSLGCTLYHLLAGKPPFSAPAYTHPALKLAAHLQDPIPPISELRPDVPEKLEAVMNQMLAKRPSDRFATPLQVAQALEPFTHGSSTSLLLRPEGLRVVRTAEAEDRASTAPEHRLETVTFAPDRSGSAREKSKGLRLTVAVSALMVLGLCLAAGAILLQVAPPGTHPSGKSSPAEDEQLGSLPREPKVSEKNVPPVSSGSAATPPAGTKNTPRTDSADTSDLANQGFAILKKYCYRCHGIDFKVPGYNVLDRNILVARHDKEEPPYVTPGDPDKSLLWQRVGVDKDMPPSGAKPSDAEIQQLKRWILAGAPFPGRPARPFKTEKESLLVIRNHLRVVDAAERRFQRYFTLTHLYNNNQNVNADELRLYRAAFAKLANSLSWKPSMVVPRAVDAEGTIYNVDLRILGWDQNNLWQEILKAYPYGLTHDQDADADTRKLAQDVADLSGNGLPYLRADWFVATASRPPLYHALLQLPVQAQVLERQLGVDTTKDFLNNQLARAGLLTSGVSKQNRLLDRHDAVHGWYWKSYDFKSNEETGNLVKFPLGPVFPANPFPSQAFEHAGGEIIFSLPNGLQGYLLVDNRGKRIDEGPIAIVRDSQETAGSPVIVNGLSCMACHKHGMIRFEDKLRAGSAVAGAALLKVQDLYRGKEDMNSHLAKDESRFLQALEAATGSFLKIDDDKNKAINEFPEPIGAIARLYVKDLNLEEVALELGLSDPKQLRASIQANGKLRELGLGPLLLEGGAIKRELWSSQTFTTSLFQNAARELALGTPIAF